MSVDRAASPEVEGSERAVVPFRSVVTEASWFWQRAPTGAPDSAIRCLMPGFRPIAAGVVSHDRGNISSL